MSLDHAGLQEYQRLPIKISKHSWIELEVMRLSQSLLVPAVAKQSLSRGSTFGLGRFIPHQHPGIKADNYPNQIIDWKSHAEPYPKYTTSMSTSPWRTRALYSGQSSGLYKSYQRLCGEG